MIQEFAHPAQRNKIFLINYTEYVYRELLKRSDYSMNEISAIVDRFGDYKKIDKYFDSFIIDFAEWVINQNWDKTSASLGVDDNGNNMAKSTEELLEDFKQYLTKKMIDKKQI